MNLAQKIAVAVTLVAVAVFLFSGGCQKVVLTTWNGFGTLIEQRRGGDWKRTTASAIGILLVGGAAVLLLGIMRKRS